MKPPSAGVVILYGAVMVCLASGISMILDGATHTGPGTIDYDRGGVRDVTEAEYRRDQYTNGGMAITIAIGTAWIIIHCDRKARREKAAQDAWRERRSLVATGGQAEEVQD